MKNETWHIHKGESLRWRIWQPDSESFVLIIRANTGEQWREAEISRLFIIRELNQAVIIDVIVGETVRDMLGKLARRDVDVDSLTAYIFQEIIYILDDEENLI